MACVVWMNALLFLAVALCVVTVSRSQVPAQQTNEQTNGASILQQLASLRNGTRQIPVNISEETMAQLNPNLLQYTMAAPTATEINCYFDIQTIQRIGGQCVSVGRTGNQRVCQAGMYLSIVDDCVEQATTRPRNNRRRGNRNNRRHHDKR
ncbi:uncharacterized protein LOC131937764 [Physella acuta]|uniref:uncharacterized protein LOC131937764 n=1 Tax=Physella acuta TaxID=109671 RepID=UPI0027DAC08F|nr:uncharacterized protein LOC131937764 [Physella acuta]